MTKQQEKSIWVFSATFCAFVIFILGVALAAGIEKNKVANNSKNIERVEEYVRGEFSYVRDQLNEIKALIKK